MKTKLKLLYHVVCYLLLLSCNNSAVKIPEVTLIPVKSDKQFQYIDKNGKIIINPQFSNATMFRDGIALVCTSGDIPKWGYINEEGKFVINAIYKSATTFSEGLAWVVTEGSAPSVINNKGEVKFTLKEAESVNNYSEGLASFQKNSEDGPKYGFVNAEGKVIISTQFHEVGIFKEGLCPVKNKDDKWGFINKEGKIIINYQFDNAKDFSNGLAIVELSNKEGIINSEGKYIINPQYKYIQKDLNLFLVNQDGKYGWIDKEGKITINPQFEEAFIFGENDLAAVKSGDKWAYINKEGKIMINPQFDFALPFNYSTAIIISSDKIGMIDKDGKYLINPQFDGISEDYFTFVYNNSTSFSRVETDYFNTTTISSRLKFDAPEGVTFQTPFLTIASKFVKSENDFSKNSEEHLLISDEKITNDASLDFYILGNPWESYQVNNGDGWYSYTSTEYRIKQNFNSNGFAYIIKLSGKGIGKEDALVKSIEASLNGYTLDDVDNKMEDSVAYKNSKQKVLIVNKNSGQVIVYILPLDTPTT